jgi:hypothetical protein
MDLITNLLRGMFSEEWGVGSCGKSAVSDVMQLMPTFSRLVFDLGVLTVFLNPTLSQKVEMPFGFKVALEPMTPARQPRIDKRLFAMP